MGAFASFSCEAYFPLCPGGPGVVASGWGGPPWPLQPALPVGALALAPSPGRGSFISPLASGWPGQQQFCLLLSGLPGCDKRQMGL